MQKYYTLEEMLSMLEEPNRSGCLEMVKQNRELFQSTRGSTNNHQAWNGGYLDHICEVMNIVIVLYEKLNSLRNLPFSLSDTLLVTFLHDLEKPWSYKLDEQGQWVRTESLETKKAQQEFRQAKLKEYNIILTSEQENGINYIEGEHQDYTNRRRVMGPLAAICHLADVTSSRLWFECPIEKDDPWTGACRQRN